MQDNYPVCAQSDAPNTIALAANRTILVSSVLNSLYKATPKVYSYSTSSFKLITYKPGPQQEYIVEHLAGSERGARVDGKPSDCCFYHPHGLVVHEASHSCFVGDRYNHAIRRITSVNPLKVWSLYPLPHLKLNQYINEIWAQISKRLGEKSAVALWWVFFFIFHLWTNTNRHAAVAFTTPPTTYIRRRPPLSISQGIFNF